MGITELIGKTLVRILRREDIANEEYENGYGRGGENILFVTTQGERFAMFHSQDCCESVHIEDVNGDLDDLIGSPIIVAEEVVNVKGEDIIMPSNREESCTWTFYKIATKKGYVTIRWFGTSNGYYSESVSFEKLK